MEVVRQQIDREFDRYVLSLKGIEVTPVTLPTRVLEPLDPAKVLRKAQWEARVHHNALTLDPFQSTAGSKSVAYYVDQDLHLMRVVKNQQDHTPAKVERIYQLPESRTRLENVSIQVAASGLLVYSDGNGLVLILQASDEYSWRECFRCRPFNGNDNEAASVTILRAYAEENDNSYSVYCLMAKTLVPTSDAAEASYSLAMLECLVVNDNAMDVDCGARFQVTQLMEATSLPSYMSFSKSAALVLVEGHHVLNAPLSVANMNNQHKRAHDNEGRKHQEGEAINGDDDEDGEEDSVIPKMPRAGIGYHGKTPPERTATELGNAEGSLPLNERFQKSSTPFSSLEEPLCSASSDVNKTSPKASSSALEVPTPDSILGGFEECDDLDPNATAVLYRYSCQKRQFTSKMDIDCRNFRFLCASSATLQGDNTHDGHALDRLLFQHDVHGLVFEVDEHQQQQQNTPNSSLRLKHVATFPAFGFVQASKQQKKFVSFDAMTSSFALVGEFDKRVYLYHGGKCTPQEAQQHIRKQHVVEIGDQQLYGMQIVDHHELLLLTSNLLVVLDVVNA